MLRRRWLWAFATISLLLAAPAQAYVSPTLAAPTSAYVGRDITVYCQPLMPYAYGVYDDFEDAIYIDRYYCNPLRALAGGHLTRPWRTAVGLVTLTHEATHAQGVFNEGRTECLALQQMDDMAIVFGATSDVALSLQALATPDSTHALRSYGVLDRCRQNGAWDLTPNDGVWP